MIWTGDVPVHNSIDVQMEVLEFVDGPDHLLLPALGTVRFNYGYSTGDAAVDVKNGFPRTNWSLFGGPTMGVNNSCPDAVITSGWLPEPLS